MNGMLSYEDALQEVLGSIPVNGSAEQPLLACLGHVLDEDVISPINLPPFDNSAMDGYAVRSADLRGATPSDPVQLRVVEEMKAGLPPSRTVSSGEAIQINTGGQMPDGADAVVPLEDAGTESGHIVVTAAVSGDWVRQAGEDISAGELALAKGVPVRSPHIGMAAALGRRSLVVVARPTVAVIGTGSELTEPGEGELGEGKIFDSNSYALAALVVEAGGELVARLRAADDPESLRDALDTARTSGAQIVVTSGGVSVGAYDLVKDVVGERGRVDIWRVAIRPGKPFAFGRIGDGYFFGLPGNPASSMVTFELFVRPAIRKMRGLDELARPTMEATLAQPVSHGPGRRSFLRAETFLEDGELVTRPAGKQGSHLLGPLVAANSLLILPEDVAESPAGSIVTVMRLDEPGL